MNDQQTDSPVTKKAIRLVDDWKIICHVVEAAEVQLARQDIPIPSRLMCRYLIAGEDHRFQYHPGVDPIAICRAIWNTLFVRSLQGGSTIAMQLVRTACRRYEHTCSRKLCEAVLALLLTLRYRKRRLPDLYLLIAYYGWGMNNFIQACARLRIDPTQLSEMEAAELVARLKYPEPRKAAARRRQQIRVRAYHLISLVENGRRTRIHRRFNKDGAIQNAETVSGTN